MFRQSGRRFADKNMRQIMTFRACPDSNGAGRAVERRPAVFDPSWPILIGFGVLLCLLIMLPLGWLAYSSLVDRTGAFTLNNFRQIVTNTTFVEPFVTTLTLATTAGVACCLIAAPIAWLVARTDMPLRRTVRVLVTASFVTPPFLGAVAWELLAAPNSGLLNQAFRALTGAPSDDHLLNIYSFPGLTFVITCYTFPYVFVLVANALDRMPGELEDASAILGGAHLVHGPPHHHPARAARAARRCAGRLPAGDDVVRLARHPRHSGGLPHDDDQDLEPFPYPPKPELGAAAALPLSLLTIILLRTQHMILGRRGYAVVGGKYGAPQLIRLGRLKWLALAFCFLVLMNPVFLPYGALLNAAFSHVASQLVIAA